MRFARSLKGRLAILTAVAIVVTGTVVLLFGFFIARTSLRDQVFKSLEGVVTRTSRGVQDSVETLGSFSDKVASQPQVQQGVTQYTDGPADKAALIAQLGGLLDLAKPSVPLTDRLMLITANGGVIAQSTQTAETSVLNVSGSDQMIARAALGRTAYDFTVRNGQIILFAASPVYREGTSSLVGVLVIDRHATDLERELTDTSGLGPSGKIVLSKLADGEIQAAVPTEKPRSTTFVLATLSGSSGSALVKAAHGERGEIQTKEGSANLVVSFDSVAVSNWGVTVSADSKEAFAPVYRLRNVDILVIVVLLIGGCALAYLIARSIARPLEELQDGVKALAGGELGTRVTISDGLEVTTLADEFNKMAGRLDDLYQTLEKKVDERTRELQEANERLKILDELKSDFVSMASHELRSPLSSMKMGVATVVREMVGSLNDEQKMMLTIAERNIDRLTKLTTDLLDLTKIEARQLDLELNENDLFELAREVVESDEPAATAKDLRLEVISRNGPVTARCDRDRVYQVLQNLLGNAINYTDEGSVTVSIDLRDDWVEVDVTDTGPGISPQAIGTIFEKWSQAHADTRSEKRGTGLGLAICKGIVEAHGGSITVQSQVGEGTTFTFRVPVRGPDERKEENTDS